MKRVFKFLVLSVIILVVGYISYKIYSGIKGKNEVIKKSEVLTFHFL